MTLVSASAVESRTPSVGDGGRSRLSLRYLRGGAGARADVGALSDGHMAARGKPKAYYVHIFHDATTTAGALQAPRKKPLQQLGVSYGRIACFLAEWDRCRGIRNSAPPHGREGVQPGPYFEFPRQHNCDAREVPAFSFWRLPHR